MRREPDDPSWPDHRGRRPRPVRGRPRSINLIPRLYDVTGGAVLIDGVDVRDFAQEDPVDLPGLVPQKAFLFSGTVGSERPVRAAGGHRRAGVGGADGGAGRGFVRELPEGPRRGDRPGRDQRSGGQRQRLSIARALDAACPIYIFDDSFSALGTTPPTRLRAALAAGTGEAAVIIVAQRVSTIRNADQIVVLDRGRVVGVGTHAELMQTCETYQEIVLPTHRGGGGVASRDPASTLARMTEESPRGGGTTRRACCPGGRSARWGSNHGDDATRRGARPGGPMAGWA